MSRQAASAFGTRAALLVEDDAATRSLITNVLRRESFEVDSAADPEEALAKLNRAEYEVVVLDLRMNDQRALRLLEHLREHAPTVLRRVVIVTAAVHLVRHGLPATVCRVLTKPFHLHDFVAAVARCAGDDENELQPSAVTKQ